MGKLIVFEGTDGSGKSTQFALLRRRLKAKEEQTEQKTVILLSGLMFLAAFVAAGLGWRFGRLLPAWLSWVGALLFLLGACTDYERAGVNPRPFNEPAEWEVNPYGNAFRN